MLRPLNHWLVALLLTLLATACSKEPETISPLSPPLREGMTKLVRRLENPYSVANMQKAYAELQHNNSFAPAFEVTTTHLYVKFSPTTSQELETLKDDTTLVLYSYPLDYEIIPGTYYHDPSIPDSLPTYQYCAVPVGKVLPDNVKYEVLEKLCIPDEQPATSGWRQSHPASSYQAKANKPAVDLLVQKALQLTNNLPPAANSVAGSWRPAGRIRVWDDFTNEWRPMEGVKIKARRWFTTYEGTTNQDGYYSCNGTFSRDANYSLDWERYDFALREGWLDGASLDGPKQTGDWNLDFYDGQQAFQARVFRAAYAYYYGPVDYLKRPPLNGTWKTQLKIRCHYNQSGRAFHSKDSRYLGLGSPLHIYTHTKDGEWNKAYDHYRTTVHELAHASHWELRKGNWTTGTEDRLQESWAIGVSWQMMRKVYLFDTYNGWSFDDMNKTEDSKNYTPLIVDLLDNLNQRTKGPRYPNDPITGFQIHQIEGVLKDCSSLADLRDQLKSKYPLVASSAVMDPFFQQYITLQP